MLSRAYSLIDGISSLLLWASCLLLVALIAINANEVVARYALSAPTVWAYDLASLFNGALFLFGLAHTLRVGGHVRIDVLAARLPRHLRDGLTAGFYLLLLVPCLALVLAVALGETWAAAVSGERLLSAWEPPLWPGYLSIAIGLAALLLQSVVTGLRALGVGPEESGGQSAGRERLGSRSHG